MIGNSIEQFYNNIHRDKLLILLISLIFMFALFYACAYFIKKLYFN